MGFQPMDRPLISEYLTNHDCFGTCAFLAMKLLKIFGVCSEVHGLEHHATFFALTSDQSFRTALAHAPPPVATASRVTRSRAAPRVGFRHRVVSMTDRRQFLSRASLALGAAALSPSLVRDAAAASADDLSDRLQKAVIFSMFNETDLSILDRFKLLKDAGFEGVEIRVNEREERKAFREAVDKTGLVAHSIMNAGEPDLETAIGFASDVGATAILYVGRYDHDRPLMESWREAQETVRKGLPAAERNGVKILIENVWAGFLFSPFDMKRFVDEIDHPWFGAYYDIGNNARWGVPHHWFEILGDRIGRLHIKEWDERKHRDEGLRAGFSSEIGEGTIDWAAVREAIVAIDYRGWITAEVRGGDRERMAEISRRMDDVLALG